MSNIKKNASELIGNTPLLEVSKYQAEENATDATIIAKLDLEIVLDEDNYKNKEKDENFSEFINMKENEELKRLEEINESKDKKIMELVKKIIKMTSEKHLTIGRI